MDDGDPLSLHQPAIQLLQVSPTPPPHQRRTPSPAPSSASLAAAAAAIGTAGGASVGVTVLGGDTEEEESPFLSSTTSSGGKKRTPRGSSFSSQHQEPLLLPSTLPSPAATLEQIGKLSKYIDPDRHVERGPYHGKTYPDSLTYEPEESEVWRTHELQRVYREQSQFWTTGKKRAAKRWLLTAVTGVLIGLLGVGMTVTTQRLVRFRFRTVTGLFDTSLFLAFLTYIVIGLLYVLMANLTVLIEPVAAGSGIPEVKAFLNGVNLPKIVRVKTMLCKMIGVIFTVGSGLPAGKEGPMVHIGAVVAAGVSQGRTSLFGIDTSFSRMQDFRNDREKRDFVSCGAASGVASAFGAPLGGVLFSLEEGASFWSSKLTYRAFLCAMLTAFTLLAIRTAEERWGTPDATKMFSFGKFISLKGVGGNYSVWELALFLVVGCLGGLLGALFNYANERLTKWRMIHIQPFPRKRCLEALIVCTCMSTLSFLLPLMWTKCTPLPSTNQSDGWTEQERQLLHQLVPFRCDPATHYNELASLFFTDSDTAIKQLFHFRETGSSAHQPSFSSWALILYFLPYLAMSIWTYGLAVPSGLFVPTLLSGAAFGRLFGHWLHVLDDSNGTYADSGTYALVGAAAVLGGMARMTISLTVILLEATGDMQYVIPLMLTLMTARWVGNLFNEGLYDIHSRLKGYPVLEPDMPPAARKNMVASQIMSPEPQTFRRVERVGVIYDRLAQTEHDCFPVINAEDGEVLVGTVLRKALCVILQHKAFAHPESLPPEDAIEVRAKEGRLVSPLLNWSTLEKIYPRYPQIQDIKITERDRDALVDLRPVMNTAPYCINESASVVRTYRLFRTMGLRHLCVINSHNQVTGIITRFDLLPDSLRDKYQRVAAYAPERDRSYYARERKPSAYTVPPEMEGGGGGEREEEEVDSEEEEGLHVL